MRGVNFPIWISPRIWSQNRNGLKDSVRDLCQSDSSKNIEKTGSLPCPFKLTGNKRVLATPTTTITTTTTTSIYLKGRVSWNVPSLCPFKIRVGYISHPIQNYILKTLTCIWNCKVQLTTSGLSFGLRAPADEPASFPPTHPRWGAQAGQPWMAGLRPPHLFFPPFPGNHV